MENLDTLLKLWDEGHWEFTLAFEGLSDDDLWRRADPRLLSVGELAGHVAYWEAQYAGEVVAASPLRDDRFRYYTGQVRETVKLDLTVAQVLQELKSIHDSARKAIVGHPNLDAPFEPQPGMTWRQKF